MKAGERPAGAAPPPERPQSGGRRVPVWALAVLAGQLLLMIAVFNPVAHNGGDTAGYVTLAHSLLDRGTYTDLWLPGEPPHTKYPPVFPAMLAIAIALGARTWAALKVVPALFTTISILLIYLWARDRRGPAFAASVALLTAASKAVLWSSHWELSEPPFMAFTFLSLWAYDRVVGSVELAGAPDPDGARSRERMKLLAIGAVAAGLAYFTRSAGLPLVVAAGVWLLWHRRFGAAAAVVVPIGLLAMLWSLRGGQGAQYVSEFWMLDPYQPDLGRAGVAGLARRVLDNTVGYVTLYVPNGLTGLGGSAALGMGVALFGLAGWGWWIRLRATPTVAELFVPMYIGLIFLWPQSWSGDRFALPLFPMLLFYAGERLLDLTASFQAGARRVVAGFAIALVALPALGNWSQEMKLASGCGDLVRQEGAFACWGERTHEFVQAAVWSGTNLPEDAVVLSRKPRIFYVQSGIASETFPFTKDVNRFLAFADSVGARYVVMDYMDAAATAYVAGAVVTRGGAFCVVEQFRVLDDVPTQLFGIKPKDRRGTAEVEETEGGATSVAMDRCDASFVRPDPLPERTARTQEIPLLMGFR